MAGLAAAIRENGLDGAQITDIVRHAGASRRTFYRCFPDKEACFIALAETLYALAAEHVEAAVDQDASWQAQLDQAIDAFLAILAADPVLVAAFKLELPLLGRRGLAIQREGADRYANMLIRLTSTDVMRSAGVGPVAFETAIMLMAALDGLLVRAVAHGEPVEQCAAAIKDLFTRVLAPA